MKDQDILNTLSAILRDLLSNDGIQLDSTTRRVDVEGWDSFAYINFIVAIEQEYGIKFGIAEIEAFDTVGAIVDRIRELS